MVELVLRLIFSLAVVVGLLVLLARFGARKFKGSSDALVQVVHRQPLSRTSSVAVIIVGTRVLVLGTTDQQVSVLAEMSPDELDPAFDAEALSRDGSPAADFADVLSAAQTQAGHLDGPLALEATAPVTSSRPRPAARPQARSASKPPAWNPADGLRTLPASAAAAPRTSAALDAILAAVDAHQNQPTLPPALAVLTGESSAAEPVAAEPRRLALTNLPVTEAHGRLAGSVLSPQTWKQAFAAVTRRAS